MATVARLYDQYGILVKQLPGGWYCDRREIRLPVRQRMTTVLEPTEEEMMAPPRYRTFVAMGGGVYLEVTDG